MINDIKKILWNWRYRFKVHKRRRAFYKSSNTPQAVKKILIVKLDSIGDYILFRNFISEISNSNKYKGYSISICGNILWKELSEYLDKDLVHDFIWLDVNKLDDIDYEIETCQKLHDLGLDTAISPNFSICNKTCRLIIQSGAKNKVIQAGDTVNLTEKINYKLFTKIITTNNSLDFEFERNRRFFENLLEIPVSSNKFPSIELKNDKINQVVICPGAKFEFRRWAPENFAKLIKLIYSKYPSYQFIICGNKAEKVLAEKIIHELDAEINIINLCGEINLLELLNLISKSQLVLCNDSGPYHIAAAINVPTICISNGNHYQRFCPYPKEYNKKTLEIFPNSFYNKQINDNELRLLQMEGSKININNISLENVINEINKTNFLNDLR